MLQYTRMYQINTLHLKLQCYINYACFKKIFPGISFFTLTPALSHIPNTRCSQRRAELCMS